MFKFILFVSLFMNACVSLAQEDLPFLDYTDAVDMPAFVLRNMKDGAMYSSANHPDSAFVLEFYYNGCRYCNENAPNVKRLAQLYVNKPHVQVLEVSVDCQQWAYDAWISNHSPIGPVLNACDAAIVDTLNVSSFPTTYVFAPNKRQAMRGVGVWSQTTFDRIKRYLDQVE